MRFAEGSPFPPIAEYAFLSDRQVQALVAPSGNVEWLCLPRPDSPSVFGAMLDRGAGHFRLGPAEATVPAGRRYVPGTLVLETTWQTRTGWLVIRDALLVGPWYDDTQRAVEYERPPGDHEAEHVLLRTVRCVNGHVELLMDCDPSPDYARADATWEYETEGYSHALARIAPGDMPLRLTSDLRMGFEGKRAHANTTMREGDERFVALSWSDHEPPQSYQDAADRMWRTQEYWREWLNHGEFPDHPWRTQLQRSALTLKGLTYAPDRGADGGGDHLAARDAGGRTELGLPVLVDPRLDVRAVGPVHARVRLGGGRVLRVRGRSVRGRERPPGDVRARRRTRPHRIHAARTCPGTRTPSRCGSATARSTRSSTTSGERSWTRSTSTRSPATASPNACGRSSSRRSRRRSSTGNEPDRGIWEVRGEPKHFTSSKVFCWVALDRGARLAHRRGEEALEQKWRAVADEIHMDILRERRRRARRVHAVLRDERARRVAAAAAAACGSSPRTTNAIRATVMAIADELTMDGLVLRYRVEQTDDGLSGEEGTFTICSFWLVSALVEIGELRRARALCEKLLSFASPLQLYAEEIDATTGRHLGNFPQAFTHLALINAVVHLIQAELQQQRGFSMAHQIVT